MKPKRTQTLVFGVVFEGGSRFGVDFTFIVFPDPVVDFESRSRALLLHQRGRSELAAVPTALKNNGMTVTDPVRSHLTETPSRYELPFPPESNDRLRQSRG